MTVGWIGVLAVVLGDEGGDPQGRGNLPWQVMAWADELITPARRLRQRSRRLATDPGGRPSIRSCVWLATIA